jgi:hypothetical protein
MSEKKLVGNIKVGKREAEAKPASLTAGNHKIMDAYKSPDVWQRTIE